MVLNENELKFHECKIFQKYATAILIEKFIIQNQIRCCTCFGCRKYKIVRTVPKFVGITLNKIWWFTTVFTADFKEMRKIWWWVNFNNYVAKCNCWDFCDKFMRYIVA